MAIFTQMRLHQIIYRETLLQQYWTIFPNFLLLLTFLQSIIYKTKYFEGAWFKFDQEKIILHDLSIDWENLIKPNHGNAEQSSVSFLTRFNSILDLYAPLKKRFQIKN